MNSKISCVLNKAFSTKNHKFMDAFTAFKSGPAWVEQTCFSGKKKIIQLKETAEVTWFSGRATCI